MDDSTRKRFIGTGRAYFWLVALAIAGNAGGAAKADHSVKARTAVLMPHLGDVQHPVSTKNAEAQQFFDQGLALIFAFNHDEAIRSFRRAVELDPNLAMAHWGIGLASGLNYNAPMSPEQHKQAYQAVQQAVKLAKGASEAEQAYIAALAKRYAADAKADIAPLSLAYKEAMKELSARYPDDLDAATLYAESAMNLRPWKLWSLDGKPAEGTEEIVSVLESVLRRNPDHTGANHYYIHAVEASLHPERALPSANRLGTLAPAAGHLVHMPAHIYIRLGDHAAAARRNEQAIAADEAYFKRYGPVHGLYPMMYFSHNIHFLAVAHAMQGRYADAKRAADKLAAHVSPHVKDMPMLEGFLPTPLLIQIRFRRWNDLLEVPAPAANQAIHKAIWHFGRGMAFTAKEDVEPARVECQALAKLRKELPAGAIYSQVNSANDVLTIAEATLSGRIAAAAKDHKEAVRRLQQALEVEDRLNYMEPADWYLFTRETLGGLLLSAGDYVEAEKTFRDDLERHPRNGRALFGLHQSLLRQGKRAGAQSVWAQYRTAWKNADTELGAADF
jgi:tetratricopeptide (TPR) repeat protein